MFFIAASNAPQTDEWKLGGSGRGNQMKTRYTQIARAGIYHNCTDVCLHTVNTDHMSDSRLNCYSLDYF